MQRWKDSDATPEALFWNRREVVKAMGFAGLGTLLAAKAHAGPLDWLTGGAKALDDLPKVSPDAYPDATDYEFFTGHNNYYEFSYDKEEVKHKVRSWTPADPWMIRIEGEVAKPMTLDLGDLMKRFGKPEERLYNFRCVEAWFGRFVWNGWPLHRLLKLAEPTSDAKFVRFVTYHGKEMPNWRRFGPYEEGLRLDEAMHDLTLLTVGAYGHPLQKQNGGPIRIVVPWKYGLKSGKSLVRIELTREQPSTTWSAQAPREYPFYSNVDPLVDHPRWSQAKHRVLGGSFWQKEPTLPFNGYADEVAGLYKGMPVGKQLF